MRLYIWINTVVFLVYGLFFMILPEYMSELVTDTTPITESGLIDIRATYGGMSVGFGLLLILMARSTKTRRLGILSVILVVGGMAVGRIIGISLDGSPNLTMFTFLFLEIMVVAIGLWLLKAYKHVDDK